MAHRTIVEDDTEIEDSNLYISLTEAHKIDVTLK